MQATPTQILSLGLAATLAVLVVVFVPTWIDSIPRTPRVVVSGEAKVGAPFTLTADDATQLTDSDLRGRTMVIYFGFLADLDTTPQALQILAAALRELGPAAAGVVPLFITIDPERDTAAALASGLARYQSRIRGLTGSVAEIQALVRAYHLQVRRIADAALPGGYSFEHQSLYYLLDRHGRFATSVAHTTDPRELAEELRNVLSK
jgi:protein SCO1/2